MITEQTRRLELDGLRGAAALSVFFSHFIAFFPDSNFINYIQSSGFRILWDGSAAVNLFFILSGFVLTLSLLKKKISFPIYFIKRIFRIYPAYYLSIIIGVFFIFLSRYGNTQGLSLWAQSFWKGHLSLKTLFYHIVLVKNFDSHSINPVIWSLAIEMKMCLFIPFITFILTKYKLRITHVFILFFSFFLSFYVPFFQFLPEFIAGAIIACNYNFLYGLILKLNKMKLIILFICMVLLYGNRFLFAQLVSKSEFFCVHLSGLGSVFLLLIVSRINFFKKILSSKFGLFLGETSYSFYLLHLPFLLIISSFVTPLTNSILISGLLTLFVVYLISFFIYKKVELKFIKFGNKFIEKLYFINK